MLDMAAVVAVVLDMVPTPRKTILPTKIAAAMAEREARADKAEMVEYCSTTASLSPSNPADLRGAVDSYFLPKAVKSSRCEVVK